MTKKRIFDPVKARTIRDHVFDHLTEAILFGKIKPGERLNERSLAQQFQVSRAPIREALHILLERGLAENLGRRGIFVINLGEEDVQKICSLRIILEAEALRLCRANLTSQSSTELSRLVEKMESMRPTPALDAMRLDLEFHSLIWRQSGNEYLEKSLRNLTKPVYAQYIMNLPSEQKRRKVLDSHRSLLEFIMGKADLPAEKVMLQHLSVRYREPARFSSLVIGR